jgi:hypothetical protein
MLGLPLWLLELSVGFVPRCQDEWWSLKHVVRWPTILWQIFQTFLTVVIVRRNSMFWSLIFNKKILITGWSITSVCGKYVELGLQ